ncbi:probable rRNA maturation factor [Methylophilus rhizosphaerae]|uniref:Endoribonuclease YbeY n=1 Tax=Methylophilus rhizosphaerae TaxID=492660 RepID=A0A1G9DA55_9PROT|nr:rRNA maturation RNase YbeY [Methylophilus rhizosphaerae]SDK60796.1 probable rRNA maturation factor [Methylophilus rhizosphaerae]
MPQLDFSLQLVSQVTDVPAAATFRRWVRAALRVDTSLTIRIVDAEEGRALNGAYRGRDYATNVLTFPLTEEPYLMGDIVICAPVVAREAIEQGKPLLAHYAHMTVHGVLHLHGYDHEVEAQAELMEAMEIAVMQKLGFANPYAG